MKRYLSVYRVIVHNQYQGRFFDLLEGIRTGESKIQRIEPGPFAGFYDIVVYEEELAFLKVAIPDLNETWLEDRKYETY